MIDKHIDDLRHGEPATTRRHAAQALGRSEEQGLVPVLVECLRSETVGPVREDITWAIVQHADEAVDALRELVSSDDQSDRFSGAHVISKIGSPEYFEVVAPLVLDEDKDVALKAYRAVANTDIERAAGVLVQRLGDGDGWQRDALSDAFRKLGERGVPALVDALGSTDAAVRDHAVETLGYLGEQADAAADAIEALVSDEHPPVRLTAVSTLGQLGDASTPALERVAKGDDEVLASLAKRFLARRA